MLNPKGVKIWRPRQLYVGEGERDYVELDGRKEVDPTPANSPTEVSLPLGDWRKLLDLKSEAYNKTNCRYLTFSRRELSLPSTSLSVMSKDQTSFEIIVESFIVVYCLYIGLYVDCL